MSMYNQYEDHSDCYEPSEFDEAVDGFKELLRKQVADEIQTELEVLRKSNRELSEQAKELPKLLREASKAKVEYEAAKRNAERDANQRGVNDLLKIMATPKFKVRHTWAKGPKCGMCDDDRRINYTTPSGKEAYETCECNVTHPKYIVTEVMAKTITKTRNGTKVWYTLNDDYFTSPEGNDYIHTTVLYAPGDIGEMVEGDYSNYGFEDRESAQELADAKNAEVAK